MSDQPIKLANRMSHIEPFHVMNLLVWPKLWRRKENRLFTKMQAEIKEEVLNELKTEIAQNLKVELRQCLLEQNVRMFIIIICC